MVASTVATFLSAGHCAVPRQWNTQGIQRKISTVCSLRPTAAAAAVIAPTLVLKGALPELGTWDNTVVLVDKPQEWTSFDVCAKIRGLIRYSGVKKVGHAGTLDPMATGLLVVCCGRATKLVDSYMAQRKRYTGSFRLGEHTASYDAESPVEERSEWRHLSDEGIAAAARNFVGDILQVPPMFSAIKVKGVPLYDLARKGIELQREPRAVTIHSLAVRRSAANAQDVLFDCECSKGTYIRSLAFDIGAALGTHAHLTALRREAIGELQVADAWTVPELIAQAQAQRDALDPAGAALRAAGGAAGGQRRGKRGKKTADAVGAGEGAGDGGASPAGADGRA